MACIYRFGRQCTKTLSNLVGEVDTRRRHGNLSSTIRLFVLDHYRAQMAALASDGAAADGPLPVAKRVVSF
jgi:predicted DNA-binding ribbon-helix-helix protein